MIRSQMVARTPQATLGGVPGNGAENALRLKGEPRSS
jgi:hypothetical protein